MLERHIIMKQLDHSPLDSLLINIKELTETNCHGEALEEIALFFEDWQLKKAFEAINVLHLTIGYLDDPIYQLRNRFSKMLFTRIEAKHGANVRKKVSDCI